MIDLATAWRPYEPCSDSTTTVDDETRCAVCGWRLAENVKTGCVRGCCAHRPRPEKFYAPDRARNEAAELHEAALRAGMPPSGRWA